MKHSARITLFLFICFFILTIAYSDVGQTISAGPSPRRVIVPVSPVEATYNRRPLRQMSIKPRRKLIPLASEEVVEPPLPESEAEIESNEMPLVVADETQISDAEKALSIANSHFRREQWETAAEWYLTVLGWDADNADAAEGLVMSAFEAGNYHHAYKTSLKMSEVSPDLRNKVVANTNRLALQLIQNQMIEEAEALLQQFPQTETGLQLSRQKLAATKSGQVHRNANRTSGFQLASYRATSPPEGALLFKGWCLFHFGEYQQAAKLFEQLYKTQTDNVESARGLVASLRAAGQQDRLDYLTNQWGGTLAEESKENTKRKQQHQAIATAFGNTRGTMGSKVELY